MSVVSIFDLYKKKYPHIRIREGKCYICNRRIRTTIPRETIVQDHGQKNAKRSINKKYQALFLLFNKVSRQQ